MACIPARVLFSQLSQYLAAQGIVKPSMQVALIGLAVNLGLGLVLVVGVPFEHFSANTSAADGAAPSACAYARNLALARAPVLGQRLLGGRCSP